MDSLDATRDALITAALDDAGPWRTFMDAAPYALSMIDLTGRQRWSNQAWRLLFGGEVSGMTAVDYTAAADRILTDDYLRRHATGEIDPITVRKRYRRHDGSEFDGDLHSFLLRSADGVAFAMLGRVDPVDSDGAYDVLRHRFERVLDAQNELICEWTPDGTVVFANRRYLEFFGYRDGVVGTNLLELVPAEKRHEQLATIELIAAGETVRRLPREYDDGRSVEWVDTAIRGRKGELVSIVSAGRDVTADRAVAAELERRRQAEATGTRRQAAFVATVSHELRNPLHAMCGITELLALHLEGTADGDLATALHAQATTMERIVNDLMDLSSIEQAGLTLRPRPFELHQLLRAEVELAAATRDHTLAVDVAIDPAVPAMVSGDPDRVRQILRNVIGNAVKYTEHGSVHTTDRLDGDVIEFAIADTGIGIDEATLHRLFEPFVRGDQAAQNHQGAGLGLAIVRELIDRMGGTIEVTSRHGEGSRFVIRLPLPPVHSRPATSSPDIEADLDGMRVLVVDDDPVNRMLGEAQCTRLGATCESACDGVDALRVLASGSFDVALVDMQMPNMGGLELARIVSAQRQHPYLIGMTASAAAADREACLEAGMQGFVT